ncbi:aquaporin AQPAn.G isoform X2 [Procambarus clarkii]|uniref:aquaporin AQPAn.G isoform X2 n=1 Tax=Procambarus clarkii TaxID=6728 RepID=UPI0037438727
MGKIKDMKAYVGSDEIMKLTTLKAVLAEFLGTLLLVFVACGSCMSGWSDDSLPPTVVQIAFAFGITVATIAQSVGHVSGCHINPAVTCGMLVARYISVFKALCYIVAQCLGGLAGAAILKGMTSTNSTGNLGMTVVSSNVSVGQALGVELIITFILVLVVFGATDERRNDLKGSAPLAIGLSITACHPHGRSSHGGVDEPSENLRSSGSHRYLGEPLGVLGWAHPRRDAGSRHLLLRLPGAEGEKL